MADLGRWANTGLLLIRVGLGASFVVHGVGKFMGGEGMLTAVGSAVGNLGIQQGHYVFGLAAATAESLGGLLLILGLFFRPACFVLVGVMAMAMFTHISRGDSFTDYSHAMEVGIAFLGLLFAGPGAYALGGKRKSKAKPAGESKPKPKSSDK